MEEKDKYVFQVNLKGMISLLSEHLYSDPNTFVRELLQNGIDAITAIKNLDEYYQGKIDVMLTDKVGLIFEDNGIGLTEEEIHKFISVIGESSKRESIDADDFIGKFGIGLLSCFVVSNEIVLETRSAMGQQALRWTGKADGTYHIVRMEEERPIGTRVFLTPKKEWLHLFTKDALTKSLKYFGDLLPVPITLNTGAEQVDINGSASRWMADDCTREELLKIGKTTFHTDFIDAFKITTTAGRVKMVVFILPYKAQFSAMQSHRMYLKRMFLSDTDCRLLPKWAFFVKCLINADGLNATASRESLMANDELKQAQKEIAQGIKKYLISIYDTDPVVYSQLINTHYLHLKAVASEDSELLKILINDLPFETNKGVRTFENIRQYQDIIYYSSNIDDFKQLRRIAESQGLLIINAGYTFEEAILKKMNHMDPSLTIRQVEPQDILGSFADPAEEDKEKFSKLMIHIAPYVRELNCTAIVKSFSPGDIPVMYITSSQILAQGKTGKISADNPMSGVLGAFTKKKTESQPQLCFNAGNALVQNLSVITDPYMLKSIVHILYVQALLLGKYPVNDREMTLFNEGIQNLLIMGIDNFINI